MGGLPRQPDDHMRREVSAEGETPLNGGFSKTSSRPRRPLEKTTSLRPPARGGNRFVVRAGSRERKVAGTGNRHVSQRRVQCLTLSTCGASFHMKQRRDTDIAYSGGAELDQLYEKETEAYTVPCLGDVSPHTEQHSARQGRMRDNEAGLAVRRSTACPERPLLCAPCPPFRIAEEPSEA